jgi:hypothetical protein
MAFRAELILAAGGRGERLFTSDVIRSRAPDFDVAALCDRSDQFASLWCSHEVLDLRHKRKEIDHPQADRLFATQTHPQADTRCKVSLLVDRRHLENCRLDCTLAGQPAGKPGQQRELRPAAQSVGPDAQTAFPAFGDGGYSTKLAASTAVS